MSTNKDPFITVKPPMSLLNKMIIEKLPEMKKEYDDRLRKRIVTVAKGEK